MSGLRLAASILALLVSSVSVAADKVKVGLVTTLSGPNAAPGVEVRDGFNLAIKLLGGKLGGLPAEILVNDDQLNPEIGKQVADRYVRRDRVDFMTGIVYSNVMLAVAPVSIEASTYYISANAGPSQLAGEQCNPFFFAASWANDTIHEAPGKFAADRGFKNLYLLSTNYQAGKDAVTGFKRFYKGKPVDEVYAKLGQLDFAAELAQIRAAKPDAIYFFLPGGMGVNFIKQFVAAGLSKDITLISTGATADEDTIRATGDAMLGIFNAAHWSADLDEPANKRFVAAFEKEFNRIPTLYASQGYDAAMMINAAVRDVKGKIEDKAAVRRALRSANFESVRGKFKFDTNQFPIQNYYLRVIAKDAQGRVTNKKIGTIFTDHRDAYVGNCKMKP